MSSFLKDIDLLGYFPQLYIHSSKAHRTNLGGGISLFIWIAIIYSLVVYTWEVLYTRRPNVMNYSVERSDIPIYDLSAKEHFEFMLLFLDDEYNVKTPDMSVMDIGFYNMHQFYEERDDNSTYLASELFDNVKFGPCNEDMKQKMNESFNAHIKMLPSKVVCPQYDAGKTRKIGGNLIYNDEIYYPKVYIRPKCEVVSSCTVDEIAAFQSYTSKYVTRAVLAINYFIPNPKELNPKTSVFKYHTVYLKNTSNQVKLNFAEVSMSTDSSYLPMIGGTQKSTFFTLNDISSSTSSSLSSSTTEFEVVLTDFVTIYDRYYPKVDSIITRFFSFYLYLLYVGTILRGCLHTFNLERYLINSTIINESSIKVKYGEINNSEDFKSMSDSEIPGMSRKTSSFCNNLQINLVDEISSAKSSGNINGVELAPKTEKRSISLASDQNSDCAIISPNDSKLNKIKTLYEKIRQLKVKLNLKQRYSCSSLPDNFKKNVEYLYKILDARGMIKLYLQFEKMKQIVFTEKQKQIFELFVVDISFIDNPLYNKNIEEMNDEEIKSIMDSLEGLKEDTDDVSKNLIKLLPEEVKKIMFN